MADPTEIIAERSKTARANLEAAIAKRDAAGIRLAAAVQAENNAQGLVDVGEAGLRCFDGLDAEILAHRAQAIEIWSSAGAGANGPSMDLSEDLSERRRERQEVHETLLAAKGALSSLRDKRVAAQRDLAAAESAVKMAVHDVMVIEAEAVADGLEQAQAVVDALRFRLRAFLRIQGPGAAFQMQPNPKLGKMRDLSAYPQEPFSSAHINPEGAEMARWQAYRLSLISNPNSVLV